VGRTQGTAAFLVDFLKANGKPSMATPSQVYQLAIPKDGDAFFRETRTDGYVVRWTFILNCSCGPRFSPLQPSTESN